MQITSAHNPLLQRIRKAVRDGGGTEDGLVVAEGPHLLEEAMRGTWRIASVITTPSGRSRYADLLARLDAELIEVSARAFESIAATEHSQQILALLEPRKWNWMDLTSRRTLIVALDGMQDPGNLGTIIRSAEAFEASGVVCLRASAHCSNAKVLRASTGSAFRMPFLESVTPHDFLQQARNSQLALYALSAGAETPVTGVCLSRPLALIVGNEGAGISPELRAAAQPVGIPTSQVESLNAAVACSIALFVSQIQRAP
jgi:TrmH family RNA methyltransferase